MKVGDLVKYESWHTALQGLTGIVIERREQDGYGRVRVLWSASRPMPIRWDWAEELRIINENR